MPYHSDYQHWDINEPERAEVPEADPLDSEACPECGADFSEHHEEWCTESTSCPVEDGHR